MFGSLLNVLQPTRTMERFIVWVDGAGAFLVLTGDRVTLGRATPGRSTADALGGPDDAEFGLLANLSRKHVTIQRCGEDYVLDPHSLTAVEGRRIEVETILPNACDLVLNDSVRMSFSVPTPLSGSARLKVTSGHRPPISIDGVVLMADTCLLGPGRENHIRCPHWNGSIVLVNRPDGLAVRSRMDLFVDQRPVVGITPLRDGQTVVGQGLRFRLERVK